MLEAVSELQIVQLKRFRNFENSVQKIYRQVNFLIGKAMIRGRNYELKGVTYPLGSPVSGQYAAAVKLKVGDFVIMQLQNI